MGPRVHTHTHTTLPTFWHLPCTHGEFRNFQMVYIPSTFEHIHKTFEHNRVCFKGLSGCMCPTDTPKFTHKHVQFPLVMVYNRPIAENLWVQQSAWLTTPYFLHHTHDFSLSCYCSSYCSFGVVIRIRKCHTEPISVIHFNPNQQEVEGSKFVHFFLVRAV